MVYAVAMKTIEHFERALGRKALWAPRMRSDSGLRHDRYVRQLRIYTARRSSGERVLQPARKALLLGYFCGVADARGRNPARPPDLRRHCRPTSWRTRTHALLDGLHRFFLEPSNDEVLAFHEAFADIVALFQHFSMPELLRHGIVTTHGGDRPLGSVL